MLAPLVEDGKTRGWLEATYASRELFEEILASVDTTFAVQLSAGSVELFRSAPAESHPRATSKTKLELPSGLVIDIGVEPSPEMIAAAHSHLPAVTLAGGLVLSLLLTLALGLRNVGVAARSLARGGDRGPRARYGRGAASQQRARAARAASEPASSCARTTI